MKPILIFLLSLLFACSSKTNNQTATTGDTLLTCKLTTAEMDYRKQTVLSFLRKRVLEKKELDNGYAFKFDGSDGMIDTLVEFAKTERHCCDFFTFNLAISGDTSKVWFHITGPKAAKEFITSEMQL